MCNIIPEKDVVRASLTKQVSIFRRVLRCLFWSISRIRNLAALDICPTTDVQEFENWDSNLISSTKCTTVNFVAFEDISILMIREKKSSKAGVADHADICYMHVPNF